MANDLLNPFGKLTLEETNQAILYCLSAMLEKMPRVTGNDQSAVSVEGGTVGVTGSLTGVTTVTTVTNVATQTAIGGQEALTVARAQMIPFHLYNQIVVS